jgi:glycine cleavage system transcriptional repressor
MNAWYMLALVGKDQPGIVAKVTKALFQGGCNLGEASMMRLGGNFSIMLMVESAEGVANIEARIGPVAKALGLQVHLDAIEPGLHKHLEPDVRITVHGADRAGIVAHVTDTLDAAGLNILDLESAVAGSEQHPIYVLSIEGQATQGMDALEAAAAKAAQTGIEVRVHAIDTVLG